VHIALNQLRLVVNRLIDVYGPPDEIVIELARELKLPREEVEKRNKENRQNFEKNQKRRDQLKELNIEDTGEAMARLRLWEDQHVDGVACCPYSLRPISIEALNGGQIDIDHILPFSRTLDDSPANKVVCFAEANRRKGNRTPHEAFSEEPDWERIVANAEKLPRNKRWRFAPDAMERFNRTERNFLDRQLVETQYLSRLARSYLQTLTPNVWVVTGQLTALLRGKWGLNRILDTNARKNRDDHRHHAVDAITIGCTSRSLLQRVATQAERAEQNLERLFADFPEPIPGFFEKARSRVLAVVVSHKPEHGKGGGLHEDTAYGLNVREDEKDLGDVVYRKAIDQMTVGDAKRIRDPDIRRQIAPLVAEVEGLPKGEQDKAIRSKLRAWAMEQARAFAEANPGQHRNPVRRLRILKPEAAIIPITDRRTGAPYKGLVPAENWCMDIVRMRDGSWKGFAANIFEVNRKGWRPVWEREKLGGLLVMRLHKGDMVEVDEPDGRRTLMRVSQIWANLIQLAPHHEAGKLDARHKDAADSFRFLYPSPSTLKKMNCIKVRIDEIGILNNV
jgi:CRISPR-associated endonuclease Csn1